MEKLPFEEEIIGDKKIRIFHPDVDSEELKWHRDRENRLVEILENDDWCLQMDDELPKKLIVGEKYKIPIGIYHRVIKGKGILKVSIEFY